MKRDLTREIQVETLHAPVSISAGVTNVADFDLSGCFEALMLISVGALGGATTLALTLQQKTEAGTYTNILDPNGNAITVTAFALTAGKVLVGRIDARALSRLIGGVATLPIIRLVMTTAVSTAVIGVLGIKGSRNETNEGDGEDSSHYPVFNVETRHALIS